MCFHRVECWNFYPSSFNKASCCIHCKRNPDVVDTDYAFDYYNPMKGEKVFRAPLIPRKNEDDVERTGEATIKDDFGEVDAFINQMDKTNKIVKSPADLRQKEVEAIEGTEGELLGKPEPEQPSKRFTLDPAEVMLNRQKKMKETEAQTTKEAEHIHEIPQLEEAEKVEEIEKVEQPSTDEEKLTTKIDEIMKIIEEENKIEKDIPANVCPYCKREFKRVDAHIRWCKEKPTEV